MTAPHVYVDSDIPEGVTIAAWRCGRRRQATSSIRRLARALARMVRTKQMTRDELRARVEHWRQRLLPEWRVVLFDEPPPWADDDDHRSYFAICQTAEDYSEARLYFTDEALARDDADIEVTIVHELVHPIMRELRSVFDRIHLHPAESLGVRSALVSAEERAVDRLSRAIVALDRADPSLGPTTKPGQKDSPTPDAIDVVDHH